MSVQTEADKKIESARVNLKLALRDISAVIVDRVSGSDDFTRYYLGVLADAMRELVKIIDMIRN